MEKYPDHLKLDMSEAIKKFQALRNLEFGSFDTFLENFGNEIKNVQEFIGGSGLYAFIKSSPEPDTESITSDLSRIKEQSALLRDFVDDLYFGIRHWNRVKNLLVDMETFAEKHIESLKNK